MLDQDCNIPSAIQEPITIESIRNPLQRINLFGPATDEETSITLPVEEHLETDSVVATGRMQSEATSLSKDPTSISHVVPHTAVNSEKTGVHLDKQPAISRNLESHPANSIKNQHDLSTQLGRLHMRSTSIGLAYEVEEDNSDDDVYFSAEEGVAEVKDSPRHETTTSSMLNNQQHCNDLPVDNAWNDSALSILQVRDTRTDGDIFDER
jgi:hypothetical protein